MGVQSKQIGEFTILLDAILGRGSFGVVYKCVDREGKTWAAKQVSKSVMPNKQDLTERLLGQEVNLQRKMVSPHVVKMKQFLATPNNYYIFLDFCEKGDLKQLLAREKRVCESRAKAIMLQLLSAMQEMNAKRIIHRDIKPENILIASSTTRSAGGAGGEGTESRADSIFKIADFGFAKLVADNSIMRTYVGTPLYMDPQILLGKTYDEKCDIYSLGIIFYEMLNGSTPWPRVKSPFELIESIKHIPVSFNKDCSISSGAKEIILRMIEPKSEQRISFRELIKHPYFANHFGIGKQISNEACYEMQANNEQVITTTAAVSSQDQVISRVVDSKGSGSGSSNSGNSSENIHEGIVRSDEGILKEFLHALSCSRLQLESFMETLKRELNVLTRSQFNCLVEGVLLLRNGDLPESVFETFVKRTKSAALTSKIPLTVLSDDFMKFFADNDVTLYELAKDTLQKQSKIPTNVPSIPPSRRISTDYSEETKRDGKARCSNKLSECSRHEDITQPTAAPSFGNIHVVRMNNIGRDLLEKKMAVDERSTFEKSTDKQEEEAIEAVEFDQQLRNEVKKKGISNVGEKFDPFGSIPDPLVNMVERRVESDVRSEVDRQDKENRDPQLNGVGQIRDDYDSFLSSKEQQHSSNSEWKSWRLVGQGESKLASGNRICKIESNSAQRFPSDYSQAASLTANTSRFSVKSTLNNIDSDATEVLLQVGGVAAGRGVPGNSDDNTQKQESGRRSERNNQEFEQTKNTNDCGGKDHERIGFEYGSLNGIQKEIKQIQQKKVMIMEDSPTGISYLFEDIDPYWVHERESVTSTNPFDF